MNTISDQTPDLSRSCQRLALIANQGHSMANRMMTAGIKTTGKAFTAIAKNETNKLMTNSTKMPSHQLARPILPSNPKK